MAKLTKKKDRKNKNKRLSRHKWKQNKLTPIININTTNILKKKKKSYNISKILYFNYNKKNYYANNCIKSKN